MLTKTVLATFIELPNITIIQKRRLPFLGTLSLWLSALQLKQVLHSYKHYTLTARGPLAGWICLRAKQKFSCSSIIIQARGLLAEEYRYAHPYSKNWLKNSLHNIRAWQLEQIERNVYASIQPVPARPEPVEGCEQNKIRTYGSTQPTPRLRRAGTAFSPELAEGSPRADSSGTITIEAVSTALKNYLIKYFNAQPIAISIAAHDIPTPLEATQRTVWRTEIRNLLGLKDNRPVYCYNGSVKAWQCPDKVIRFFKETLQESQNGFLLVLTQDKAAFTKLLAQQNIATTHYAVLTVPHKEIYRYLAACDTGLLFREKHIVNWVSRPTKALEYQSVGLHVVHNNTVAWLTEKQ